MYVYIYLRLSACAVHLKLSQYCLLISYTLIQNKKVLEYKPFSKKQVVTSQKETQHMLALEQKVKKMRQRKRCSGSECLAFSLLHVKWKEITFGFLEVRNSSEPARSRTRWWLQFHPAGSFLLRCPRSVLSSSFPLSLHSALIRVCPDDNWFLCFCVLLFIILPRGCGSMNFYDIFVSFSLSLTLKYFLITLLCCG